MKKSILAAICVMLLIGLVPLQASANGLEIAGDTIKIPCSPIAAHIVHEAMGHLGEAYVSGKEGNQQFDCIGLVRTAYLAVGINLKRAGTGNGTRTWAEQGLVLDVSNGEMYPGDILCWYKNPANKSGQPDHVAIYTGWIQLESGTSVAGYKTDAEGYLIDSSKRRVDCVNALNPRRGVCLINSERGSGLGRPTDVWRAPATVVCYHDSDFSEHGICGLCGAVLPYNSDHAPFQMGVYRVSTDLAYFRTQPYQYGELIQTLRKDTEVEVVGALVNGFGNLWYSVRYRGTSGYIVGSKLELKQLVAHPCLTKGSKGDQVKALQTMLNQAIGAGLQVDGSFGEKTETALKRFQLVSLMKADGFCGPATWLKLERLLTRINTDRGC